ncbi:hypothetical protein K445DRAFT_12535 [Daldinia sp. EC12]|nr:hypothetical protein K445DRAFT_12535 [Daldinia sp. EC12]
MSEYNEARLIMQPTGFELQTFHIWHKSFTIVTPLQLRGYISKAGSVPILPIFNEKEETEKDRVDLRLKMSSQQDVPPSSTSKEPPETSRDKFQEVNDLVDELSQDFIDRVVHICGEAIRSDDTVFVHVTEAAQSWNEVMKCQLKKMQRLMKEVDDLQLMRPRPGRDEEGANGAWKAPGGSVKRR